MEILSRQDLIQDAYPVISAADLSSTEKAIGFELPTLLKDLYLKVGNGGFGPHFGGFLGGFNGYSDEGNVVEHYLAYKSAPESFLWPDKMVPFFHWGCACYCCLDCSTEDGVVVFFDPGYFVEYFAEDDPKKVRNPILTDPVPAMRKDANSLQEWLETWLAGISEMGYDKPPWRPKGWRSPQPRKRIAKLDGNEQLKFDL